MASKGQAIIIALDNVKNKRKIKKMQEKMLMHDDEMMEDEDMMDEKQGRILRFKSDEIGDKFVELGNGKILKLNVYGRVIGRGNKSGTMTIDAINIAKDEKSNDSETRIVPRPSA